MLSMPWIARKLRGTKVFARIGEDGTPEASKDGRVDIIYNLSPGAKVYRASLRNLEETGDPADDSPIRLELDESAAAGKAGSKTKSATSKATAGKPPKDAIIIYTDGACTGNPGPAGLGAVIVNRGKRTELSEYLGRGTNNIAELTAILRALQKLPAADRERPIHLHTDSSYSIGVLTKGWKAKANQELIAKIKSTLEKFPRLTLVKVKGHAGVPENERADELARKAANGRR